MFKQSKFAAVMTITALGAASMLAPVQAAEQDPNPADLTQTNTFVWMSADSKGNTKVNLGLAGQYSEGNTFLGLIEHGVKFQNNFKGTDGQNSRLRYFQVLDTGSSLAPKAGASVDYMKGWKHKGVESDIVALGGIAKVNTPLDTLTIYPNLAYVTGDIKAGGVKKSVSGYQANLFASLALSESGNYAIFQPQWMDTNVGSKFEMKTGFGAPVTDSGKLWMNVDHVFTSVDLKGVNGGMGRDNDNKFEVGISYYF